MGLLYFFETTVDVPGVQQLEFVEQWLASVDALAAKTHLKEEDVKHLWKIPGERKMVGVFNVSSPGVLDTCFAPRLPMQDQLNTSFTPIRPYEDFAADLANKTGEPIDSTVVEGVKKAGLHYLLSCQIEYHGITQQELFRIWAEEAKAALKAKKSGTMLDLWKVVGERKVLSILCVDEPGELDQILFDLPIMKNNGNNMSISCKSIRQVTDWISDLKT